MNSRTLRNLLFAAIVLLFFYYAWQYILASSFVINGQHYYVLFDDAMISMRYAWNLAHGNGLVWNAGERVEAPLEALSTTFFALIEPPALVSIYRAWLLDNFMNCAVHATVAKSAFFLHKIGCTCCNF